MARTSIQLLTARFIFSVCACETVIMRATSGSESSVYDGSIWRQNSNQHFAYELGGNTVELSSYFLYYRSN